MEIAEQIKEHDVTDYDFMFNGGNKLTITIDHDAGDTVEEQSDRYVLNTVARISLTDPNEQVDAETVDVFKTNLAVVARCKRKQRMPSEEETYEMHKMVHNLAKMVQ